MRVGAVGDIHIAAGHDEAKLHVFVLDREQSLGGSPQRVFVRAPRFSRCSGTLRPEEHRIPVRAVPVMALPERLPLDAAPSFTRQNTMYRIPSKLYVQLPLAAVFLTGLVLVSCATMPPETPTSVRAAQQAIADAERLEAARYAAGELSAARTRLASAQGAVNENNLVLANQLADESRAEAELAAAKTAEAKASAVNADMKRSTGALVEEMKRGVGDKP